MFAGYGAITAFFLLMPVPWSFWLRALAIGLMAGMILAVGVVTPRQLAEGGRALADRARRRAGRG